MQEVNVEEIIGRDLTHTRSGVVLFDLTKVLALSHAYRSEKRTPNLKPNIGRSAQCTSESHILLYVHLR